jgi:hypothetical protein
MDKLVEARFARHSPASVRDEGGASTSLSTG